MQNNLRTQHLIEALEYILEVAEDEPPAEALKEIKRYSRELAEITELYRKEDPEYEERKKRWREQRMAKAKLKPMLVDNGC